MYENGINGFHLPIGDEAGCVPEIDPELDEIFLLTENVGALIINPRKHPSNKRIRSAIEVMPYFHSGYDRTFVVPMAWQPSLITEKLSDETSENYQNRTSLLLNPLEVKSVIERMESSSKTGAFLEALGLTNKIDVVYEDI